MERKASSHPVSEAIAAEAWRYLTVIEHVLALDYLRPDLRRRVIRMQRQLIKVEMNKHFMTEEPLQQTL